MINVPGLGISSPGGETVLLPNLTVKVWLPIAAGEKPGGVWAATRPVREARSAEARSMLRATIVHCIIWSCLRIASTVVDDRCDGDRKIMMDEQD